MGATCLAHSANRAGVSETVSRHLLDVARLAAEYGSAFGAGNEARLAGLLHDIGKYGQLFQMRLEGKVSGIDHWSSGAWAALCGYRQNGIAAAVAVAGHHVGLRSATKDVLSELNPLMLVARRPQDPRLSDPDVEGLLAKLKGDAITLPAEDELQSLYDHRSGHGVSNMLDIRMLYSALVDADFIETEAHFEPNSDGSKHYRERGPALDPNKLFALLREYVKCLPSRSSASDSVQSMRSDLFECCVAAGSRPQGLFTLTAPTGSGKTLGMLGFALKHAATHDLRRVITVLPYLTIIAQTVDEYRKALGDGIPESQLHEFILEHDSLAGTRCKEPCGASAMSMDLEDESERRRQLLAENWDSPVVVTTSVQFLESLFANRSSACRKLHRIARSVVLFDEVQTLPPSLAVPTLAALSRLVERYGVTVVFSTATQPAFRHFDRFVREECAVGWRPAEIVPPELKLFERVRRVSVAWGTGRNKTRSWSEIAESIAHERQALCIVNLKRHAFEIYENLDRLSVEGLYHLSTNMCPKHRDDVLRTVRERLESNEPCRLVSTQCVEAGVDLDFPTVLRAFGPLDAIAQASGRCNRSGKRETRTVHVFIPEDERYPTRAYQQATTVTELLLKRYGKEMDISNPEIYAAYYQELYDIARPETHNKELQDAIKTLDFEKAAREYRLIDQDAINVLVPYDESLFKRLKETLSEEGISRKWIAEARPYSVSVFRPRDTDAVTTRIEPVEIGYRRKSDEWYLYLGKRKSKAETEDGHYYDPNVGLVVPFSSNVLIG